MTQGGIGIELWTMTEDILFDNIYIGHSVEDASKFKAETFDIKKPLEVEQAKPKTNTKHVDDEEEVSFSEDPIEFIRSKVFKFVDLAKLDPVLAFKTQPEVGAVLVLSIVTFFGMLGAIFGLVGGSQPPVTKVCSPILRYPTCELTVLRSLRRRPMPLHPTTRRRRSLHPSRPRAATRRRRPQSRSGSKRRTCPNCTLRSDHVMFCLLAWTAVANIIILGLRGK